MATSPIYAGGSRRGAAPVVNRTAPQMTQAQSTDDVLNNLVRDMQAFATQAQPRAGTMSPVDVGRMNVGGGMGQPSEGTTGKASLSQVAGGLGAMGQMAGAAGYLGKDAGLSKFGGTLGTLGTLAGAADKASKAQNFSEVATAVAPIGLQALGASAPVSGAVMGGLTGGVPGAVGGLVRGGLFSAMPAVAIADLALSAFGLPSISGTINNAVRDTNLGLDVDPNLGYMDAFSMGRAIATDEDPIGALINALSPAVAPGTTLSQNQASTTMPGLSTGPSNGYSRTDSYGGGNTTGMGGSGNYSGGMGGFGGMGHAEGL